VTDTPSGVTALMDAGPPAAAPLSVPEAARADAFDKLQNWRHDGAFLKRLAEDDPGAKRELEDARRAASTPTSVVINGRPSNAADAAAADQIFYDRLQDQYALTPAQVETVRNRMPATPEQARYFQAEKERLLNDRGFRQRLLDGDRDARNLWGRIILGTSLPVAVSR